MRQKANKCMNKFTANKWQWMNEWMRCLKNAKVKNKHTAKQKQRTGPTGATDWLQDKPAWHSHFHLIWFDCLTSARDYWSSMIDYFDYHFNKSTLRMLHIFTVQIKELFPCYSFHYISQNNFHSKSFIRLRRKCIRKVRTYFCYLEI